MRVAERSGYVPAFVSRACLDRAGVCIGTPFVVGSQDSGCKHELHSTPNAGQPFLRRLRLPEAGQ